MATETLKEAAVDICSIAAHFAQVRAKVLLPNHSGPQEIAANMYFCCLLDTFLVRYYHMEGKRRQEIISVIYFMRKHLAECFGEQDSHVAFQRILEERVGASKTGFMSYLPDSYSLPRMWDDGLFQETLHPTPHKVTGHNYGNIDTDSCNGVYSKRCLAVALKIVNDVRARFGFSLTADPFFQDAVSFCSASYPYLKKAIEKYWSVA